MQHLSSNNPVSAVENMGFKSPAKLYVNLTPEELVEHTILNRQGELTESGAVHIRTGEFTGRSPKDRFVVKDDITENTVDWNKINLPFKPENFDRLYNKIMNYFEGKDLYVRDAYACADDDYRLNIRVYTEYPWSNQFAYNMFLRPTTEELENFDPEWTIVCAPGLYADPETDGTRQHNFAILNFSKKQIIIGGTGYTGEIKKGIFSALNFILPHDHDVLSMHCSANIGKEGDTAIFFGLSGTGKTTLSADPNRMLVGDDEHGWSENGVFNFEGGCYAKTINLSKEYEPEIYGAIKHGAILENIDYIPGTRTPDYAGTSITQNTRVSYPIHFIDNSVSTSRGGHPKNIFFLTADAFGVLPPISRLTKNQAKYLFMSGYTAKVAGTEADVKEPRPVFSACFGHPFMPLHPQRYADMLGERMEKYDTNIWLVNTGWTGGDFDSGSRISLKYTRAMITAALRGKLIDVGYERHPMFGLHIPTSCPNVPSDLLNPRNTWDDKEAYDKKANHLAAQFRKNFEKFADNVSQEIIDAGPQGDE